MLEDGSKQESEISDIPHPAIRIVDYIKKLHTVENCTKENIKWTIKIKKHG